MSALAAKFANTTEDHLQFVANHMRDEDVAEVWATGFYTPHQALVESVKHSDYLFTVLHDGIPLAIVGLQVRGILTGTGIPWLLSSDEALKHKRLFMTLAPVVLQDMLRVCSSLENFVHVENSLSIHWLKRLGFDFGERVVNPVTDEPFYRFSMRVL